MAKNSILSKFTTLFQTKEMPPKQLTSPLIKWEISEKGLNPYYGLVSGTSYATTGMPWLSSDARKAVMTEWFWQPIRGQPRRVDTNELRKYSNTIWVQSIVMTILNLVSSIPWDIVPKEGEKYEACEEEIKRIKSFFETPNKNKESFTDIVRAWLKDVLEIDAGVLVKVFTLDSYDFEHLEPRSGAPLLKPLVCPVCSGEGKGEEKHFKEKAIKSLKQIEKAEHSLPETYTKQFDSEITKDYNVAKPNYEPIKQKLMQVVSYNSANDANAIDYPTGLNITTCPYCNGSGKGRELTEIYCRDGASFLFDSDRTGWNYGAWQYSYAIPAHPMWFNRDEIIYFKQNSRSMSVYGYSAVQSSLEVIKSLEYSVKHNMSLFLDGAVPDGIVAVEDMSDEEMKRMKTAWENELKGQPHKVVFLNKKTNFVPFAFNNRDMQFIDGQKSSWQQVISSFNMTPQDLGIPLTNNRSSGSIQVDMTRRKAIRPLYKKIEQFMNSDLMLELGAEKTEFKYIVDDPVEERKSAELSEIYVRNGFKTINEIRTSMGMSTVAWGDENPLDQKPSGGIRSMTTGRASEVREERDGENEAARRDNTSKDYQSAFQAQVPFITATQNLSTPTPFALPKDGHPNTKYPYADMAARCPGCGATTIETIYAQNGSITEPFYHCVKCDRKYSQIQIDEGRAAQEKIHGIPSPKVVAETNNMSTRPTSLLGISRRVQDYTEAQGYPKKELAELDLEKKKEIRKIILKSKPNKAVDKIFDLGIDQGTAIAIVKNADLVSSQIEIDIRREKLLQKGALLIDQFEDFVRIVESNENGLRFNQVKRFVEEKDDKFTFMYADKYYSYECDVAKDSIINLDEFNSRFVTTATPARKRKKEIVEV